MDILNSLIVDLLQDLFDVKLFTLPIFGAMRTSQFRLIAKVAILWICWFSRRFVTLSHSMHSSIFGVFEREIHHFWMEIMTSKWSFFSLSFDWIMSFGVNIQRLNAKAINKNCKMHSTKKFRRKIKLLALEKNKPVHTIDTHTYTYA